MAFLVNFVQNQFLELWIIFLLQITEDKFQNLFVVVIRSQLESCHAIKGLHVQREVRLKQHFHDVRVVLGHCQMHAVYFVLVKTENVDSSLGKDLQNLAVSVHAADPIRIYSVFIFNVNVDSFIQQHEIEHFLRSFGGSTHNRIHEISS